MSAITQQHLNGAAILTRTIPGWPRIARLETLDMSDPRNCLLAQLCSPSLLHRYSPHGNELHRWEALAAYLSGVDDRPLVAGRTGWKGRNTWSVRHGFWPTFQGWEPLTQGWRELAAQLRSTS